MSIENRQWHAARLAAEQAPTLTIEANGMGSSINGTYMLVPDHFDDGSPIFRNKEGRWLYVDEAGRWHVSTERHKKRRAGGDVGYLRSGVAAQGLLPADIDACEIYIVEAGWRPSHGLRISGTSAPVPKMVISLHALFADNLNTEQTVTGMTLGGNELATLHVDPHKETLVTLKARFADYLGVHGKTLDLVLPNLAAVPHESTCLFDLF